MQFLENTIARTTQKPVYTGTNTEPFSYLKALEIYKPKLIPWSQMKQTIFQIYDHRIHHAPEIQGMISESYLKMDEHLVIYFLERSKGRTMTERSLVDFLSSLKYYSDKWNRAKLYC